MSFEGIVRSVTSQDLGAVQRILEEGLRDEAGRLLVDDVRQVMAAVADCANGVTAARYEVFCVAQATAGEVVGVAGLQSTDIHSSLYDATDNPVELVRVYIAATRRRGGVGTALVDRLEAVARDLGYTKLVIESGARNRKTGYPFWRDRYGEPVMWLDDFYGPGAERVAWTASLLDGRGA